MHMLIRRGAYELRPCPCRLRHDLPDARIRMWKVCDAKPRRCTWGCLSRPVMADPQDPPYTNASDLNRGLSALLPQAMPGQIERSEKETAHGLLFRCSTPVLFVGLSLRKIR